MNRFRARVDALREQMVLERLDAFYITGTDPHMSEYLPDRWQTRAFISGFTGSYGIVVITASEAGLWTDSRYFLQAESQLHGTGLEMYRLRVPGAISPQQWLSSRLFQGDKVGIHAESVSVAVFRELEAFLSKKGISLVPVPDLLDRIWENRPGLPQNPVFELDLNYTGFSRQQKFSLIADELDRAGAEFQLISMLDELAWTFNLRGGDVPYNPVFTGYGIVGRQVQVLFVTDGKIPPELEAKLMSEGIQVKSYPSFSTWLSKNLNGCRILLDPLTTNCEIAGTLPRTCTVAEGSSIPAKLKSRKNKTELDGFRSAMLKDGIALMKFLFWLRNKLENERINEYDVGRKLAEFRSENEGYAGESFPPLIGYGDHGAMVHFTVNEENANEIKPEGVLLFDSGGHYREGTTDVTRTVVLGEITDQQRIDFTLVLKGMIALTRVKFPEGTKGCHLDILARKSLWEYGLNYGHGTGHGIGHYLNVHEGPMSIRQEYNPNEIEPGMVLSNEPAIYRGNQYGIRIENMMVCIESEETEYGKFYAFDTLTLCPVDTLAIKIELLTADEIEWVNNYHMKVRKELLHLLPPDIGEYLISITKPIGG